MTYLVTGATGFIGGRLARRLLAAGHRVHALARHPEAAAPLEAGGARVFRGDLTRPETLRPAMDGVDGVFHVAAWYAVGVPAAAAEPTNVQGTRNVLETALALGVPKVVYTSTVAVFGDTRGRMVDESYFYDGRKLGWASEYDRTKWIAHYEVARPLAKAGLPLVTVLPGLVYGPGDHSPVADLLRDLLRNRTLVLPAGTVYCWSHVDDVAAAHQLAMEKGQPGEDYIVAGEPHPLVAAARRIRTMAGSRSRIVGLPNPAVRAMGLLARPFDRWLPPRYTSEGLRAAATSYTGSSAKARRELGYDPRPLDTGMPPTLEALRNAHTPTR